jgi:primosomal protein N' (replication factor Y)
VSGGEPVTGEQLSFVEPQRTTSVLASVAVDRPGLGELTYLVPAELADLAPGDAVVVPLGPRQERGFVTAVDPDGTSPHRLRPVVSRVDGVRLPAHLLTMARWGATYYRCSLGQFLGGVVPSAVKSAQLTETVRFIVRASEPPAALTTRQRGLWQRLPIELTPLDEAIAAARTTLATVKKLVALGAATITDDVQERKRGINEIALTAKDERYALTDEQQAAVDAIVGGGARTTLLHGVTGSGKTLVYLDLAERVIAAGRQVLFLLPEIGLTPQLAARVRRRIPRTVVWHSAFSAGERAEAWRRVAGGETDLVLGTRSALFAPLPAPGLIIVDEEHDPSYKQDSTPRYHARDLAVVYGRQLGVSVVLGSATPSLETVQNVRDGRFAVARLTKRPAGGALPVPAIIDMREECHAQKKAAVLSRALVDGLQAVLARGEQAIVLLNRRGWSPIVTCGACGHVVECPSCAIAMTFHRGADRLRCHYCDHHTPLPVRCPACGETPMDAKGVGTEQLEQLIRATVPGLRTLRVDADTVSGRQGHATLFGAFAQGEADCLVGTQMVAKGLDFPRVTLVGVLCADRGLAIPDFRSAERTYQLIAQVAGRAGRADKPGRVIVQAYDVNALALTAALHHTPKAFYNAELELRKLYGYPPYAGLIRILWSGERESAVSLCAQDHGDRIKELAQGAVVLGPGPAGMAKLKDQFRWHALIKCSSRGEAQRLLDRLDAAGGLAEPHGVRVAIDVDPLHTS